MLKKSPETYHNLKFAQIDRYMTFTVEQGSPKIWAISAIKKTLPSGNNHPFQSGHPAKQVHGILIITAFKLF
jgi:hypothetical protein